MASNPLNDFIKGIGTLVEQWIITYQQFRDHGFDHKTALEHTQAFTAAMLTSMKNDGKDGGKQDGT